jgi:hypothetical protein
MYRFTQSGTSSAVVEDPDHVLSHGEQHIPVLETLEKEVSG